jgi:hypothetical protein
MSHLDLSGVCVEQGGLSAGAMFTLSNPLGQMDAVNVKVKRSDGTEQGWASFPAGEARTTFVPGEGTLWVKVIATFPRPGGGDPLVKIRRLDLECSTPATTTPVPPTIVDTIPPTTWVEPATTVPATATTSTRGTLPPAIPMTVPATHPGEAASATTTVATTAPAELAYTGGGDVGLVGLALGCFVLAAVAFRVVKR